MRKMSSRVLNWIVSNQPQSRRDAGYAIRVRTGRTTDSGSMAKGLLISDLYPRADA
jgi:hypothetical protein